MKKSCFKPFVQGILSCLWCRLKYKANELASAYGRLAFVHGIKWQNAMLYYTVG